VLVALTGGSLRRDNTAAVGNGADANWQSHSSSKVPFRADRRPLAWCCGAVEPRLGAGLQVRALLAWSARPSSDGIHKSAFALKKQIPNCAIRILHGAGHACQIEQPWLFNRYMIEFLKDHGLFPVLRQG